MPEWLAQILGPLLAGGTALGDQLSQWGSNSANDNRYNQALGLNRSLGDWGHSLLDRNAGQQNIGYHNLATGANNFFFGGGGPNQLGLSPINPPTTTNGGQTGRQGSSRRRGRRGGGGLRSPVGTGSGNVPNATPTEQILEQAAAQGITPEQLMGGGGNALGGGGLVGAVNRGYSDLRNRALAAYEGYGEQGRRDINQQFDVLRSQARGDATRRGMASSSILGGLNRGVERERADALGRHNERVQLGGIGLDTSLTGSQLSNLWNTNMGAFGATNQQALNALGAMDTGNMRSFNFGSQNIGDLINIIASRNDVYQPTPLSAYQGWGAGSAPAPNYPSDNSGLLGGLFSGIGTATGAGIIAGAGGGGGAAAALPFLAPPIVFSDRNAKRNISETDNVLGGVRDLEVSEWEYTDAPGVRHMGPMAQDFRRIFGLGDSDKQIHVVDALGVALAAVKALAEKVDGLEARLLEKQAA